MHSKLLNGVCLIMNTQKIQLEPAYDNARVLSFLKTQKFMFIKFIHKIQSNGNVS